MISANCTLGRLQIIFTPFDWWWKNMGPWPKEWSRPIYVFFVCVGPFDVRIFRKIWVPKK